ncbi:energy-coupling factor transporter transmembrane component T [Bacillus horti]|uniref:Energy-coupling factor transport system permease protein n=1 Tax=Caldalkalibacillus horti TaxID=77523 RepID=A0ABT9VWD3_9BACI|nr:energy-coupling factor transporter transmembrane component T [Bacillus horti]MDQ0165306.1 energy-coupling factor transport system permease protein [Bacillus horti]
MSDQRRKWQVEFDPRLLLLLLLSLSGVVFLAEKNTLLWLVGFMSILLILQGMTKAVISFLLVAVACYSLQVWDTLFQKGLLTIVLFFTHIGLRLLPVMMASYALSCVPSGKLIAALRKCHIPAGILVALAVGARFLPVIRSEFEAIQLSARLRGLSIATPTNWIRPLKTFEHSIVPLLMKSLKIADELAASATTKGIDAPFVKTSLHRVAFQGRDIVVLFTFGMVMWAAFYFGGQT